MMTNKLQTKRNTGLNAICKTATALLFSVSILATFMACSHDDDLNEKSKSNKKEGTIAIKTHDNLAAFQNTIVETNEEGMSQGTIFFNPGTEENHIAEVTASPETQVPSLPLYGVFSASQPPLWHNTRA